MALSFRLVSCTLILGSLGAVLYAQNTAQIQGTVQAPNGTPIPGAVVLARTGPPRQTVATKITSDKAGHFTLANLAAGTYFLCTQIGHMLDPCVWAPPPSAITVTAGQISTGNVLRLAKGAVLKVRLNDPSQLLKAATPGPTSNHALLGVWTPDKFFFPLTKVAEDSGGRDYQLSVPYDKALTLTVVSQ